MLVLSRKTQERIQIGDNVVVTVLRVKGNMVRIGIEAPKNVRVMRAELPNQSEPAPEVTVEQPGSSLRKLAEAVLARRHDAVKVVDESEEKRQSDFPVSSECELVWSDEILVASV
jgi:carbon storage regulator CsrA